MGHYDDWYTGLEDVPDRREQDVSSQEYDNVNRPLHYNSYPGIEVIQLTEHLNFCKGNVIKYVARAEYKGNELEDLRKALWYLQREIERIEKANRDCFNEWHYPGE